MINPQWLSKLRHCGRAFPDESVACELVSLMGSQTMPGQYSQSTLTSLQNDWNLVRSSAVTPGRSGQRNESQHRQSTVEKKTVQPRNEPKTPQVKRTYTEPQVTGI